MNTPAILAESAVRAYLPAGLYLGLVILTGAGMLGLSRLLGPSQRRTVKLSPYECGMPLLDTARHRISVKFYLVAILFVVFDIEVVFLFPWAVIYRSLGVAAVVEMLVFLGILILGFVYAWRRGGLDWE